MSGDCGLNIDPSDEELVTIAKDSTESFKSLIGDDPKVAFLSFSTNGSGKGNEKITNASKMMKERYPEEMMERAVKGMLPHNRLGRQMYKKLFVYKGSEHKQEAQKPEVLEVK